MALGHGAKADDITALDVDLGYCIPKGVVSKHGVIVRFGTRYIRTCQEPLPSLEKRQLLLNIDERIRIETLGITTFRTVRIDERFEFGQTLQSQKRNPFKAGQVQFGEAVYDRYDLVARTYTGGPSASLFVHKTASDQASPRLPEHFLWCNFPNTPDKSTKLCRLWVKYKGLQITIPIFQGGTLFLQTQFEEIPVVVEDMIRLVEFADVTESSESWPEDVPVYD